MSHHSDSGRYSVRVGLETLPKDLSAAELARYFQLEGVVREAVESVRELGARMALAVQAGAVRAIGRFLPDPGRAPLAVVECLAEELGIKPTQPKEPRRAMSRWDQERRLTEALRVRRFEPVRDRDALQGHLAKAAQKALGEDDLLAEAELYLRRAGIVLPAVRYLRRLARECRRKGFEGALSAAAAGLDKNAKLRLHHVLEAKPGTDECDLVWLSRPPGDPKVDNLEDLVARKKRIEELGLDLPAPLEMSEAVRLHLIQRAEAYSAWELQRLPADAKYGYLVLRLRDRYRKILDWITFMHGTILHGVRRKAKNAILKKASAVSTNLPELMTLLGDLCEIVLEHASTPALIGPEILRRFGLDTLQDALDRARSFTARGAESSWDYLYRRHGTVKAATDLLLDGVPLVSPRGEDPVLEAVEFYREHDRRRRSELPPDAPLGFVPSSWRERVVDGNGVIQRKAWQLCLAEQVTEKLKTGQLVVPGSASFEEMGKYVVPAETWERERPRLVQTLAVEADPAQHLEKLRKGMDEGARTAAAAIRKGSEGVRVVRGRLMVTPLDEEEVPERDERACAAVSAGVRTRRIEELLLEVDERTRFLDSFTHLGSGRILPRGSWEARTALLAAILAKGFNHGLATLARSVEGMTRWKIEKAAEQYIRPETVQAATARLVDFQKSLRIARAWGDGTAASADGRRTRVLGESLYAGYNPRYFAGHNRGIVTLTHVADLQTPFYTQVIPVTVREAGYVLDGLLGHGSSLRIERLYVDTHGITDLAAAVHHVMGYRLAPRLANLRDRRLWLAPGMKRSDYGPLGEVFAGAVSPRFITEQWDEMLRAAASIREGHVRPSVLIRRLASLPRSAPLFRAWQDLGRLVTTHWVLEYASDPRVRRTVLVALNKGEEVHNLARTFSHGTDGGFRTGDHLAQLHATSCLNLLIACVSVANALEYERVWEEKGGAAKIPLSALRHLSPLSSESVIYLGKYWFPKDLPGGGPVPAKETA